jgi:ribokinase
VYVERDGANRIVQAPRANRNVSALDFAHSSGELRVDDTHNEGYIPEMRSDALFRGTHLSMTSLETDDAAAAQFQLQMWARDRAPWTILNAAPARQPAEDLLRNSAIVIVNETEASTLAGEPVETPDAVPEARARIGCTLLVVTFGRRGAAASKPGSRVETPAFDVDAVDTTGAGDAFCAALGVRLAEGAELEDAMRFASAAGAVACTRHGAYESMPSRREVEALIAADAAKRGRAVRRS